MGTWVTVHGTWYKALLDGARQRGLRHIVLGTTAAFLAAHRFYEKHGFVQIDERALPAEFPRMAVDTRFYALEVPADP